MKLLSTLLILLGAHAIYAQEQHHPVIEEHGGIFLVPEASVTPDSSMVYKIAIDFYKSPKGGKDINFSLDRVARTVNLHNSGGVSTENMDIQVIAYAGGVNTFLSDEAHQKKHGRDNPNSELIDQLHAMGVKMVVCGQSIRYVGIDHTELNPNVEVATSYITALTTAQHQGYVLLHF